MEMIIFLLAIVVFLDVASLKGWSADSREARDWTAPQYLSQPFRNGAA